MFSTELHHDSPRLYIFHNGISDLSCQLFLDLQSSCINLYSSCQLADPYHFSIRNIGNMCLSIKRHQMMLTDGVKGDILFQDHLIIFCMKGFRQLLPGILLHALTKLLIHSRYPVWGIDQSLTQGILSDSF